MRRVIPLLVVMMSASAAAQTRSVRPVWPDEGPFKWAARPTTAAITANDLRSPLNPRSDHSMMGRRIGEPGN